MKNGRVLWIGETVSVGKKDILNHKAHQAIKEIEDLGGKVDWFNFGVLLSFRGRKNTKQLALFCKELGWKLVDWDAALLNH